MNITEALAGVSLLGADTATFIYFAEQRAGYVDKMERYFIECLKGKSQRWLRLSS